MRPLEISPGHGDTVAMDTGCLIYILSRLILGALASFFAIMVWAKTRDTAWMLVVIGAIAGYAEVVYSILGLFGITGGTFTAAALILANLPACFFIAAFLVMAGRKLYP
jgi:hypothetical protein